MTSILHRLNIETSASALYKALTTSVGLSAWWTKATAEPQIGSFARFEFGPTGEHQVEMQIQHLEVDSQVVWKCTSGPWVETGMFQFDIEEAEKGVFLRFSHQGWPQADEFYMHCNSKWGYFLVVSLKQYLETGTGHPHPEDPNI